MSTVVHAGRAKNWVNLVRGFILIRIGNSDSKGVIEVLFGFEHELG